MIGYDILYNMEIKVFHQKQEWVRASSDFIVHNLHQCIEKNIDPFFAVSGGSTPFPVYAQVSQAHIAWDKVTLVQVDERFVPASSPESNWKHIVSSFPSTLWKDMVYFAYNSDIQTIQYTVEKALPEKIDMMVLGMGLDGHFASLFPQGEYWNRVNETKTLITQAPDTYLTAQRLTLSPEYIYQSQHILVLLSGKEKYEYLMKYNTGNYSISEFPLQYLHNHPNIHIYCCLES